MTPGDDDLSASMGEEGFVSVARVRAQVRPAKNKPASRYAVRKGNRSHGR